MLLADFRDFALILGYVLTERTNDVRRRNAEWHHIRWGDLRGRGARIYSTCRGKNMEQARNELPPPVWEAIRDYLEADGRLATAFPRGTRHKLLPSRQVARRGMGTGRSRGVK